MIQQFHSRVYIQKTTTFISKDACTPVSTVAVFTMAKTWKQPKCLSEDKWIKKMYVYTHTHTHIFIHNGILFSHKKE